MRRSNPVRTIARCVRKGSRTTLGRTVTRSVAPLPSRTTSWPVSNSTSFIRKRSASFTLRPPPYSNAQTSHGTPESASSNLCVSPCDKTTGKRFGLRALTRFIRGSGCLRTASYRNSSACFAWFCVDAATFRSSARCDRNCSTSAGRSSAGCRGAPFSSRWKRQYLRIQPT